MDVQPQATDNGITKKIFENHLFDANFFTGSLVQESQKFSQDSIQKLEDFRKTLQKTFEDIDNWGTIEANVSTRVIVPLLNFLEWPFLQEKTYIIQGSKQLRPDFVLFQDEDAAKTTPALSSEVSELPKNIAVILEAKAADKTLDTGKINRGENPYGQLLDYLTYARIDKGFLCNGKELWLVDNSQLSTSKRFVKVDLMTLAKFGTTQDWQLFYLLFARKAHIEPLETTEDTHKAATVFEHLTYLDTQQKNRSECELRDFIYGTGGKLSMIELIGKALYRTANKRGEKPELADIFTNAQFLAFRLLFLAFFESRYLESRLLPEVCRYEDISLHQIFIRCKNLNDKKLNYYTEWQNIQNLFSIIDKGNKNLFIPLFNGGLFNDDNAPMLAWPLVFDNKELLEILDMLFIYDGKIRDFTSLSVTQLGTIYEGLLGFEFRITNETTWYLDYQTKGKEREEGYFGIADYSILKSDKKTTIFHETKYEKGNLYFVSMSNSRKNTASYYTPSSLTGPVVKRAIDHLLSHMDSEESILDVRILDSACGSGHLLVEGLNYLTNQALLRIDSDQRLNEALTEEKQRIAEEFVNQGLIFQTEDLNVDEISILKRILLKKNIYGVDIQQFSVELTCLSLWIESFIFGTPLSFLEHHIKQGNSLIGCSRKKFEKALSDAENEFGLLKEKFQQKREVLFELYKKLSSLRDTTSEDIKQSKKIYREEIQPIIDEISFFFDCLTMKEIKKIQGIKVQPCRELFEKIDTYLYENKNDPDGKKLVEEIKNYKNTYRFFNWALEFPEAFANGRTSGFHVIIGNPPWDKTKFSDADFFSQYRSNYRTVSNSKKKEIKEDILDNKTIAKKYENEQKNIKIINEYYKNNYPKNAGAGDGNLFRFFVEKNLILLRCGGTLNYILPTVFMTEDGSETLRRYVLKNHHILAFDGFENREKLFPDFDNRYKFGLLQIEKELSITTGKVAKDYPTILPEQKITKCRFMLTNPSVLADESTAFDYSLQDVQQLSTDHWAFMEVKNGKADLDILAKLYGKFPPLSPSWIDFRAELHATNDKEIFKEKREEGDLPLYKGACIWQYDSCYWERTGKLENTPQYWLNPDEFDNYLKKTEINRLITEVYEQLKLPDPRKTKEENVLAALNLHTRNELGEFISPDRNYFRLAFREIARDTDERTLITSVIPPNVGAQHTLFLSIPKNYIIVNNKIVVKYQSLNKIFLLQGIFNSILMDWIIRFSTAIHVSKTYLMRLPIPQLFDNEINNNKLYSELIKNSLLLSYTNNKNSFNKLLKQFEIKYNEIPSTEKKYMLLQAKNDVLVAKIYGITKNEMLQILKGFPIFTKKSQAYIIMLLNLFD